jgi:hypothetical protein
MDIADLATVGDTPGVAGEEQEEEAEEDEATSQVEEVVEEVESFLTRVRKEALKVIMEEILPEAITADKTGKDVVIILAGEAIRMPVQLARFILTSPWLWGCAVLAAILGSGSRYIKVSLRGLRAALHPLLVEAQNLAIGHWRCGA